MTEADFVALWKENPRKADALVAEKVMDVVVETDPIMGTNWWTPEAYTTTWEGMGKVVGQMRKQLFSGRQRFYRALQEQFPVEGGHIAWPDIFLSIEPVYVAIAAGKALGWIEWVEFEVAPEVWVRIEVSEWGNVAIRKAPGGEIE